MYTDFLRQKIWRISMFWKKWLVALATVMVTTQVTPASAQNCGSYECETNNCGFSLCDCDPCDGWSLHADWLYWNTRKCDLDYAFTFGTGEASGHIESLKSVCPSWDCGFRVGLQKMCGDMDFGVHYTYYKSTSKSSTDNTHHGIARSQIGGEFAATSDGNIGYASGGYDLLLNQIDFEIGYGMEMSDCLAARLFSGLRYASINQKFNLRYSESITDHRGEGTGNGVDVVSKRNDMDFYGLYLGSTATYSFIDCFDFFGGLSFGIGATEFGRGYTHSYTDGGTPWIEDVVAGDCCWRVVSVIDFNFGLTYYLKNCLCSDWAFSVGYEFHNWLDAQDFIGFHSGDDSGELHLDRHTENLGFDGLFVRVSVLF